jgi:hypothetical protein
MKNRWFPVVILISILIMASTGCGVSKSEFDAVTIELKLVKEDRQALQTQLQEAQSQLTIAETDLTRTQTELETVQDHYEQIQTDYEIAQGQLTKTQADLQTAQGLLQNTEAQAQLLQNELDIARNIPAIALSYAEFMDILMFEVWMVSGVTPNFTFSTSGEYQTALKNRADSIGEPQLINFVDEIESGPITKNRLYEMCYYCLDKLETILK